jgi:hypothetical protein
VKLRRFLVGLALLACVGRPAYAQELEPRLLVNVPPGMQFAVLAYGYSQGNILLDPAVPIEDLDASLHTFAAGYARTFSLFGRSAQFDIVVPFAAGNWEGLYLGSEEKLTLDGLGDPRVRLFWRFAGAPALKTKADAGAYRQDVIAGATVQLIMPFGEYDPSELINLGSNRWTVRSGVGVSKALGNWTVEGYGALWIFGENNDFVDGLLLEQKPLVTAKTHLIRSFSGGRWMSLDVGYGFGGRTIVEGAERDTRISAFRFGLSYIWPLNPHHSLKLLGASGVRLEKGPDFNVVGLVYQFRWAGPR